ncbi:hypothetical protein HLB44_18500 [Aquincola sp. S2]|uniref:Uncharacterized protein n=1 Tax=Pseudaquabacterium terrae TaxID=2732868 RepID=A0ABX2EK41_9BURK|nr:hypothetical protein [Aquabacterium terrae]NRF68988.1 hypothetical protein [Aquabacterium terrae]
MSIQAAVVRQWATEIAARAAARIVRQLAKMPATQSGGDSELRSGSEEFCAQVQGDESFFWDEYQDTVKQCISGALVRLPHLQMVAMWPPSDAGDAWLDENGKGRELPAVYEPDVVEVVYRVVWRLADDSKIPRVARYLARSQGED